MIKWTVLNQRYYSLDVFRGVTVCLMILVNNPGSWQFIYPPLKHAPWHGLTPTDLVFPFFLFAVGNAMSFVMPRLEAGGKALFWKKILKRTVLIFLIGLFLNWWPFMKWEQGELAFRHWTDAANPANGVRILGVLQRIALCYFFAAVLVYYLKPRRAFYVALLLLLFYWLACYLGNPADPYSLKGWFGSAIDKAILGEAHLYKGEGIPFDPEGLVSTVPAIAEVIFGYLVGMYVQQKGKAITGALEPVETNRLYQVISGLFIAGTGMLITGYCWDMVFPINKKIWTSSYTIFTSGLATVSLATLIYFIELKNTRGAVTRFFDVFGKNALFVFALSAFLPKGLALLRIENGLNEKGEMTYYTPWTWLYQEVLVNLPGDPRLGSFLYALCVILFMWMICWWLDKKKIYIKV